MLRLQATATYVLGVVGAIKNGTCPNKKKSDLLTKLRNTPEGQRQATTTVYNRREVLRLQAAATEFGYRRCGL